MPSGIRSAPTTALGARLRELRESHGWAQWQLAMLVDTQANRVSCWEIGLHEPTLPLLKRLARAFELTVSELLDGVM